LGGCITFCHETGLRGNQKSNIMTKEDLIKRTMNFAIRIVKMTDHLPKNEMGGTLADQILRSATSVGANYRAACRSKSKKDFINKLKIVEEEMDETIYWISLIEECELIKPEKLSQLKVEANELLAIFVTSLKTAKENLRITIAKSTNKS
jgi:four helix bundle protein